MNRRILSHVHRKARLTHGGTGGDYDQIALLKTVCHAIQLDKPARDSRDLAAPLRQFADEVIRLRHDLLHGNQCPLNLSHGDFVDALFGKVERVVQLFLVVHAVPHDLAARADKRPLRALGLHEIDVVRNIRGGRHKRHEIGQVGQSSRHLQLVVPLQLRGQGHEVYRVSARAHIPHRGEDRRVCGYVKVLLVQLFKADFQRAAVDEHAAEHGALCVAHVRKRGHALRVLIEFILFHRVLRSA